jgi:hypothetical protein
MERRQDGIRRLIGLLTGARQTGDETAGPGERGRRLTRRLRWLSGALIWLGMLAGGLGVYSYPPLDDMPWILLLGAGGGAALWLLGVAAVLLTRRMGLHDHGALELLGPMAALGLLVLCAGGTAALNGALDPHGVEAYETAVVAKITSRTGGNHGGSKSSTLQVADFRPGREGQTLGLAAPEVFDKVKKGDKVIVLAGRGLLDWWLEGVRMPDEAQQTEDP